MLHKQRAIQSDGPFACGKSEDIGSLIKNLPAAVEGESRRGPPVAEISSAAFSTEREQSPQCGAATIEIAEQVRISYAPQNAGRFDIQALQRFLYLDRKAVKMAYCTSNCTSQLYFGYQLLFFPLILSDKKDKRAKFPQDQLFQGSACFIFGDQMVQNMTEFQLYCN